MDFKEFNLNADVSAGISKAGYVRPTPIQVKAIPSVMQGRDVMGLAQTGTGKTAAFVLPILNRLMDGPRGVVRALIIAPTRELSEQINNEIRTLGRQTRLKSTTVYGGVNINPQMQKLKRGVEIVVACPGRLLDHINRGTVNLSQLDVLVLDEADHMFDMGFLPDIRRILQRIPRQRQTLLFSATMPDAIRHLAEDVLTDPITVQVGTTAPADTVSHALYPVADHLKTSLLLKLLRHTDTESVLVFTRTKRRAKRLGEQLSRAGYRSASLQGNLSQGRRQAALDGFRTGKFQILVATDIAARGIDVSKVSHVINYDIPDTPDAYIHRIGRTGRATRTGDAFTLITGEDKDMVRAIDRVLGMKIERRTLTDFDYNAPAPERDARSNRPPRHPISNQKRFGTPKGESSDRAFAPSTAPKPKSKKHGKRPTTSKAASSSRGFKRAAQAR
jgi:ATP-dependent RNA helicase RhlE